VAERYDLVDPHLVSLIYSGLELPVDVSQFHKHLLMIGGTAIVAEYSFSLFQNSSASEDKQAMSSYIRRAITDYQAIKAPAMITAVQETFPKGISLPFITNEKMKSITAKTVEIVMKHRFGV